MTHTHYIAVSGNEPPTESDVYFAAIPVGKNNHYQLTRYYDTETGKWYGYRGDTAECKEILFWLKPCTETGAVETERKEWQQLLHEVDQIFMGWKSDNDGKYWSDYDKEVHERVRKKMIELYEAET